MNNWDRLLILAGFTMTWWILWKFLELLDLIAQILAA